MKASLKWLKEYVDIALPPAEMANKLTLAGLEVKAMQTVGGNWENIVVGQITAISPHPNADRLILTTVDTGNGQMTVVTGAPNVRLGDKVPFARVDAQLIDGHSGEKFRLKSAKIRGIVSSGMICSEKELGISDSHEGIMVLPADAPQGMPLLEYLGDTIFDLEITPNRADCLSLIGTAREIAALTGQKVRLPESSYEERPISIAQEVSVEITAPDLCPRYCASLISGVTIAASPAWMQQRLLACGMRPINNVVDITNYVMLEHGQPLHAFDYDCIGGRKIIVRRAEADEMLVTLDGTKRALAKDMLVIADEKHPIALAGVMGGAHSEVTPQTTSILLEAANFKPSNIYHTGHALSLPSEARMRFERGLRPELALPAIRRATQLITDLAGGKAAQGILDVNPGKVEPKTIRLTAAEVNRLLGADFSLDQIVDTLSLLGFDCEREDLEVRATPPYWRNDVRLSVDLIEEVARIIGYDKIPLTMLSRPIPRHEPDPLFKLEREVKRCLAGCGFTEIITYSLTSLEMMQKLLPQPHTIDPAPLRVANPMSAEQEYLRPSLRASVLSAYSANRRHEDGCILLFELASVYLPRHDDLPEERHMLCGILGGPRPGKGWYGGGEPVDFFDAKGIAEALAATLGTNATFEKDSDESLHPHKQAALRSGGEKLGVIGEVHPKVLFNFEIAEPACLIEIDMTKLASFVGRKRFQPIPRYPAITRDIALVVNTQATNRQIQDIITSFPLVTQAEIFDVYTGEQVPPGKKSLAYRLTFQSPDHTLTDDEVNAVQQQVLDRLTKELGTTLRT